jgi:beta-carotene hydroxylase
MHPDLGLDPALIAWRAEVTAIDLADVLLTPVQEKRLARELSPPVAWPTLAMAVALPAAHWTIIALGLARILPLPLCAAILSVTGYMHYTLVHESIHGNLVPGHPRLRRLNDVVGWAGALGLWFNWPTMLRGHALHHAHTNTEDDPDIDVRGSFAELFVKWLVFVPVSLIPPMMLRFVFPGAYRRLKGILRGGEMWQASAVSLVVLSLLVLALATGRLADWLCLLFVPRSLAGLALKIFFSWLPHYPFGRTERYLNTRISLWAGGTVLMLQQNLHLMHHLWPAVPFYNYTRLWRAMRPTLIARGSPIQGLMVGPFARDLSGV